MSGALDGLLVVSVEQAVAAPYCAARLADAGARVIKIERPEGDFARAYDGYVKGESSYFVWLNRGKQSVALDFKQAEDLALLHRMISKADVLIQNLAPGAAERAGFGSAAMRARHKRLITVDVSGYGDHGPYKNRRAYDLLVQAESGLASITGTEHAPGRVGISATDIGTGMYAHAAVLEALLARQKTGEGRAISVSLFSSMAEWMTVPLLAMGGPSTNHPLSTFIWSVLLAHWGMLRLQTARAVAAHRRDSASGSPRGDCWWCDFVVVVV